jgi:cobalt-zinc-cadmium efflux system protein
LRRLHIPEKVSGSSLEGRKAVSRRLLLVLVVTALFMVVEVIAGVVSGALALVADAGHMLTDVGALGLSLFTAVLARRPADPKRTYGFVRWEILAALINGATLFGLAGWVVYEAVHRIAHPHPIDSGLFVVVAGLGILVNGLSLWLLHQHRHGSLNVRGAYLHILGDVLASLGTLLAAVVVALIGWLPADPLISVVLALTILVGGWRLVRESTDILLEAVPPHVSMAEVRGKMLQVGGVRAVHDLHVWTVTSGVVAMSGHAVVPDLTAHPLALAGLREALSGLGISHATIQLETEDTCEGVDCLAPFTPLQAGGHSHHDGHHHHH